MAELGDLARHQWWAVPHASIATTQGGRSAKDPSTLAPRQLLAQHRPTLRVGAVHLEPLFAKSGPTVAIAATDGLPEVIVPTPARWCRARGSSIPWIEPRWAHSKRAAVEPERTLTGGEL
jgi:hypothetical protein